MINAEQKSVPHHDPESTEGLTDIEGGIEKAESFLREIAPNLGRLFGMPLSIKIGNGWATNLETHEVTADPKFFHERGYSDEMCVYATLHEVAAHLKELVTDQKLSEKVVDFYKQGPAKSVFLNILSDIAGNKLIHTVLPESMPDVAKEMYNTKLFPESDYTNIPRHLQFLYKIIREEMIPDSQTTVVAEVDEAIDSLRNYDTAGIDMIRYTTDPTYYCDIENDRTKKIDGEFRFKIWKYIIYPIYERLIEKDKEDPVEGSESNDESSDGDKSQESDQSPTDESKDSSSDGDPSEGSNKPQNGKRDKNPFKKYYDDFHQNRHPEPFTDEEHQEIHNHAQKNKDSQPIAKDIDSLEEFLNQQIIKETQGHTLADQENYKVEINKWLDEIDEMREVFQSIIQQRVSVKRALSRRNFKEGAILDPNRLAQTVVDIKSGVDEPEAFKDYELQKKNQEVVGKTDYVFMFDTSGSMGGERSKSAAASCVIALEALAAMQRDIKEAEQATGFDLDLDIRTAVYSFSDYATILKPLSTSLDLKERLDTYAEISNPNGGTCEFLALEDAIKLENDSERKQIIIVVTDGESNDSPRAEAALKNLRRKGWIIYGISINSDAAVRLYNPNSVRLDNPKDLPKSLRKLIEDTIL